MQQEPWLKRDTEEAQENHALIESGNLSCELHRLLQETVGDFASPEDLSERGSKLVNQASWREECARGPRDLRHH